MQRKVLERDPKTGETREVYRDMGPRAAVPGHGRPMFRSSVATGGGAAQHRLGTGQRERS